ncbi:hypothetical protein L195_g007513 [Trifolium pratense]|uniref:Uncharacterized protein n=1 Tax=Trifolium pratense TaxID=57577 RepID=A0A2K3P6L5_TRIPR|nr:hypothetical protein L195_g007513 [Trifolium pratense]
MNWISETFKEKKNIKEDDKGGGPEVVYRCLHKKTHTVQTLKVNNGSVQFKIKNRLTEPLIRPKCATLGNICDKKFSPGHRCPNKLLQVLTMAEEEHKEQKAYEDVAEFKF